MFYVGAYYREMRHRVPTVIVVVLAALTVTVAIWSGADVNAATAYRLSSHLAVTATPSVRATRTTPIALVVSDVPSSYRCFLPSPQVFGPVIVNQRYVDHAGAFDVSVTAGFAPTRSVDQLRHRLASLDRHAARCDEIRRFSRATWLSVQPFALGFGWVGYAPIRVVSPPSIVRRGVVYESEYRSGAYTIITLGVLRGGVFANIVATGTLSTGRAVRVLRSLIDQM